MCGPDRGLTLPWTIRIGSPVGTTKRIVLRFRHDVVVAALVLPRLFRATHLVVYDFADQHVIVVCVAVAGGGDDAVRIVIIKCRLVFSSRSDGAMNLRRPIQQIIKRATRHNAIRIFTVHRLALVIVELRRSALMTEYGQRQ